MNQGVSANNSFEWICYKMHREMERCLKGDCWSQEVFVVVFFLSWEFIASLYAEWNSQLERDKLLT